MLTVVWALVLVISGTVYALKGKSTVRDQTTVATSQPTADRAIGNVVKAAGPGPIVALGEFVKTDDCRVTPVRPGVDYARTIDLFVTPGTESAVLKTIAAALPSAYDPSVGPGPVLHADAGDYVAVVGAVPSPGDIEVKAETGCRQAGDVRAGPGAPGIATAEMAPIRSVLSALHANATATRSAEVPCVSAAGVERTVSASAPVPTPRTSLATALATIAAHPTVSGANVVAYRVGATDVVAEQSPGGLTVSATTGCLR